MVIRSLISSVRVLALSVATCVLVLVSVEWYSARFEYKTNPHRIESEMQEPFKDLFIRAGKETLYGEEGLTYLRLHQEYVEIRSSIFRMLMDGNTRFFHYEELLLRSQAVIWIPCLLVGFFFPGCYTGWRYWVSVAVPVVCVATGIFVINYLWFVMLFTYLGASAARLLGKARSPG